MNYEDKVKGIGYSCRWSSGIIKNDPEAALKAYMNKDKIQNGIRILGNWREPHPEERLKNYIKKG